jgi:hypothetical protein
MSRTSKTPQPSLLSSPHPKHYIIHVWDFKLRGNANNPSMHLQIEGSSIGQHFNLNVSSAIPLGPYSFILPGLSGSSLMLEYISSGGICAPWCVIS